MSPALWGVGVITATLFIVGGCGGTDPPEDPVPGPTVTATATVTETAPSVVRTETVVPDACKDAADDASSVESALFDYEESFGKYSEIHDLTAKAIAGEDIHTLNKARELFWEQQTDSTAALQTLLSELDDLDRHNEACYKALSE